MKRFYARLFAVVLIVSTIGGLANLFIEDHVYGTPQRFIVLGSILIDVAASAVAAIVALYWIVKKLWNIK